jgi:DNA-directed RNA polymerase specialized sigma24 family protein
MTGSKISTEKADELTERLLGHRAAFLRFLTTKVGPAAAEDILQSCYLKLVEKGPQLLEPS